ncbi:C45 family autoproteolytic acyltransferase/hydolase [Streptomyces indicus]|uniref:Isopenicillin-N N-acyltransferase like protein n=1 Tax=Streptomyces indicus TaxID=417292 RepID=A0A1G9AZB6_9ACTN|nr:C45 family peptidase [Streptomyces indicus]SDK32669.1 isopenicillin-N N-acyltransferase like protein [Streptomyces indicus]
MEAPMTVIPRPAHRLHIALHESDPHARGVARGEQLRAGIPAALDVYARLFALGGITWEGIRQDAERALDVIGAFRPEARAEIAGIAHGAGVEEWQLGALNARTEILARSTAVPPGECSTLVRRTPGAAFGAQTWDWHVELSAYWHTLESPGTHHAFAGLTEHGILAKIGINSAGLALHFNILGHIRDGIGGVPMHVLAAVVLSEAGSVAEAVELVRSAPLASSGSFALFDAAGDAVLLDISPAGVHEIGPDGQGMLLRTNHFLTPSLTSGEKTWLYQPDSEQRRAFLAARCERAGRMPGQLPADTDALASLLVTGEGEPPVTCVPDLSLPLGQRWASLATVTLDPATRTARVLDGTPADIGAVRWRTLTAEPAAR